MGKRKKRERLRKTPTVPLFSSGDAGLSEEVDALFGSGPAGYDARVADSLRFVMGLALPPAAGFRVEGTLEDHGVVAQVAALAADRDRHEAEVAYFRAAYQRAETARVAAKEIAGTRLDVIRANQLKIGELRSKVAELEAEVEELRDDAGFEPPDLSGYVEASPNDAFRDAFRVIAEGADGADLVRVAAQNDEHGPDGGCLTCAARVVADELSIEWRQ